MGVFVLRAPKRQMAVQVQNTRRDNRHGTTMRTGILMGSANILLQPSTPCAQVDALPLVISATFTAEPIADALQFWFGYLGMRYDLAFAAYNQVFQSLLDPNGAFLSTQNGVNVLLFRWDDLAESSDLGAHCDELAKAVVTYTTRSAQHLLILICPSNTADPRHEELEASFIAQLRDISSVSIITPDTWGPAYGLKDCHDPEAYRLGRIPYTAKGFAMLATILARRLDGLRRPPFKVIVLDCDNTLWQGILGEDGVHGLKIGPDYRELQLFMRAQHEAGMLLALASKNNSEDVEEAFERRKDMPLQLAHFVARQVHWRPKSESLRELASMLDLSLDSFIFLDDSPAECAEVRKHCPEVLTLQLPAESDRIPHFLNHIWAFDHWKVTAADRDRSAVYGQKLQRDSLRRQATSMSDFIAGLQLQVTCSPVDPVSLSRVAQLVQRTNQFNCTGVRHGEAALQTLLREGGYTGFTVDVTDRFGSYGVVGAVLYKVEGAVLRVHTFVLSCRALGRGVEHEIVRRLGQSAAAAGATTVRIPFQPTAKNTPALLFLKSLDGEYERAPDGSFRMDLSAASAADVRYRISDEPAIPGSRPEDKHVAAASGFRAYQHLADHLCHVEQVLAQIEDKRSKSERPAIIGTDAPRTELEETLCDMWELVLSTSPIGIHDDFFALGGTSFAAVRLFSRIHQEIGCSLPENILFESATVAQLADRILRTNGNTPAGHRLVPIHPEGSRRPLFWIPGGRGIRVLAYREISRLLGTDQPAYGLESPLLENGETIPGIRERALEYIRLIQEAQPAGPYQFAGFCLGGVIAFEMAQQLRKLGESVSLLALVDAEVPGLQRSRTDQLRFRLQRLIYHCRTHGLEYVVQKARRVVLPRQGTQRQSPACSNGGRFDDGVDWTQYTGDYTPSFYPGTVLLFAASDTNFSGVSAALDPRMRWKQLASDARVYLLEGDHESILHQPHVESFAAALQAELERARHETAFIRQTDEEDGTTGNVLCAEALARSIRS